MADLASGAVRSLLGVIHDESHLLGSVETDVQFIKEEMESMNSFLLHLSTTVRPGEQVHTWMKQVRELAHDCSNSIDRYLQRGNPAVHHANNRALGYYLWWVPWYLQKLVAQHRAAIELRELKERARDVGKRRLRYGVEIPKQLGDATGETMSVPSSTSQSQPTSGTAGHLVGDADVEEDDWQEDDGALRAQVFADPCTQEECRDELVDWLLHTTEDSHMPSEFAAIAVAAPVEKEGVKVASDAVANSFVNKQFQRKFNIDVSMKSSSKQDVSMESTWQGPGLPAGPLDILEAIIDQITPREQDDFPDEDSNTKLANMMAIDEKIKEQIKELMRSMSVKDDAATDKLSKDEMENKSSRSNKIEATAKKIEGLMESRSWPVALDHTEYVEILQKLHCESAEDKPNKEEATNKSDSHGEITKNIREIINKIRSVDKLSGDDQIAQNIKETTEKIMINKLQELLLKPKEAGKQEEKKATYIMLESQLSEKKIEQISNRGLQSIKEKLQAKMVDKIKEHLATRKTLIVLIHMDYEYNWSEIRKALSSLGCAAGSAVVVTTKYTHGSQDFCNPVREPILCYLAASYYKKALKIIEKQPINYKTRIFRDILERCEPFSMKIFIHAMYANPTRKHEELQKLLDTLLPGGGSVEEARANDKMMIRFSYIDLPKDYKTCLQYLAIFSTDDKISRSRLVGRWVVEGLITKQDWPSSVRKAERCFDVLVDHRWLLCPGEDIGATGKIKSCRVDARVHEFITRIARKEHFVETRLSHHLAKHFSVLNDIRLRSSDTMDKFLNRLSGSPQLHLVKVLDLEGCRGFDKNNLKHICAKMLLLKYLSLRNTEITKLPKGINNLHQLEVLDIRQNNLTESTTKHVLLLKLKRLLADHNHPPSPNPNPNNTGNIRIPHGIGKMTNMEVLSRVKASSSWAGGDLKDIGKLWQLRKLGVVTDDDDKQIYSLLRAISDLNECLQSLSITVTSKGTPSGRDIPSYLTERFTMDPKLLESLSINGFTSRGQLLRLLVKSPELAKVTLCNVSLYQHDMGVLSELVKLRCLRLKRVAYIDRRLSFKHATFKTLKYLFVDCFLFEDVDRSMVVDVNFEVGAAPELNKIVAVSSFTSKECLSGTENLAKLKELVFNNENIPIPSKKRPDNLPMDQGQATTTKAEAAP